MADIVLVQPTVGEWDDLKSAPSLPLAFLSVASTLVDDYEVKIIDQRVEKDWQSKLQKELDNNPLFVGTNAVTGPQITHSLEVSKFVKDNSKVPVVWGGKHPSILPRQTLENENVDMIVVSEGEVTTKELANTLKSDGKLDDVKGLAFKNKEGKIKINAPRPFMDMNELPKLPYDLIDIKKYVPKYLGVPSIYIETSRGCPQQCTFCYNNEYNKCRWRGMNAEKSMERIKRGLELSKAKGVFFVDDAFFVNQKRAKGICQGIIDEGLDIKYGVQGVCLKSILRMDDEYLKMVDKSGCRKVMLGVESGSERILKLVKKEITVPEVLEVNRKMAKTNIKPSYYMMAGFPGETRHELKQTIDLTFKLLKDNPKALISPIHCFTPYPGSPMFQMAIDKQNFVPPTKLEQWIDYSTTSMNALRSDKDKKFFETLTFLSLFIDRKAEEVVESPFLKTVSKFYRPFARARLKNLNFKAMLTKTVKDKFYPEY